MDTRACRVGLHGRNDVDFEEVDYQVIRDAKIEVVKMMSFCREEVFRRIRDMGVDIITRLYGGGFGTGSHPSAEAFANEMIPIVHRLRPYCTRFQIHNEPNNLNRNEGWGPTPEDAKDFNNWFIEVFDRLHAACDWAELGFPGLAIPGFIGHCDREWLSACKAAIEKAHWLGVHCYWQTPNDSDLSQLDHPDLGSTYADYHNRFPNKPLEILECGNSNSHTPGYPMVYDNIAQQYVHWLQKVFRTNYVRSASFYILSSHYRPPTSFWDDWWPFSWRTQDSNPRRPLIEAIAQMYRPPLVRAFETAQPSEEVTKPPQGEAQPPSGGWTNQQIIRAFEAAARKLGLPEKQKWLPMSRAGLKLDALAKNREALYSGPAIDALPGLTAKEKSVLIASLAELAAQPRAAGLGRGEMQFLSQRRDLAALSSALPTSYRIRAGSTRNRIEKRVARVWNRYSYLLLQIADILQIDLGVGVAVLAAHAEQPGLDNLGRLSIRFEPQVFYDVWGRKHQKQFHERFQYDPDRPWQKHRWRPGADTPWRRCHGTQEEEWAAFQLARSLDDTAAKRSIGMGLALMMGFNHSLAGYESPAHMFDDLGSSERYQVLALFDVVAGPAVDGRRLKALRDADLYRFAALCFGERQAARYGSLLCRLRDAFQRLDPLG